MPMSERKILLIEDNPDDEALTRRAFRKSALINEIVVARDGAEAIDYLFAQGIYADRKVEDLPQLILLDLQLPKLNGIEVLERIRADERTRLLPVVMLTSSKEQEDLINSYSRGANSYVRKPVDFNEFVQVVQQLGLYWLAINEHPSNTK